MATRIIHLSDFHFVSELTQEGRAFYSELFLFAKAKPHALSKLQSLAQQVDSLRTFDLCVATGDLTTDGAAESFTTMLRYVEEEEIREGGRVITRGLGAKGDKRIMLPGNHDRFCRSWLGTQSSNDRFEQILQTPRSYPYAVAYQRDSQEPSLLFFVFDSTPPGFAQPFWAWNRVARGRIGRGDCSSFIKLARDIKDNGNVDAINGSKLVVQYSNCIRIAVLHHHPLDAASTTLMEDGQEFIKCCLEMGIDLVLFGHDHKEFKCCIKGYSDLLQREHKMHLFCAPSASEYSSLSGFFTFTFFGNERFIYSLYKWDNKRHGFVRGRLKSEIFIPGTSGQIYL